MKECELHQDGRWLTWSKLAEGTGECERVRGASRQKGVDLERAGRGAGEIGRVRGASR